MNRKLISDYRTFVALFKYNDRIWARISAQVYLDIGDFEWAGRVLLELSGRVTRGEYKS